MHAWASTIIARSSISHHRPEELVHFRLLFLCCPPHYIGPNSVFRRITFQIVFIQYLLLIHTFLIASLLVISKNKIDRDDHWTAEFSSSKVIFVRDQSHNILRFRYVCQIKSFAYWLRVSMHFVWCASNSRNAWPLREVRDARSASAVR